MLTRKETLELHTLTEEEQKRLLKNHGVLQRQKSPLNLDVVMEWESLADCAFRLKDELKWKEWRMTAYEISDLIQEPYHEWAEWSKPIHWIQASLLAKLTSPSHPQA